ncbi:hypothetical protein [Amycolatopsis sp. NPDC051371]|uniref:hypothetical protein n=1 Tax=Amycolatopsis sp. NPDC051371 TaxID=3155800 RepID=UPI00342835BB
MKPPIQSDPPTPGLSPLELAQDVLARIERANEYARSRKFRFRRRAVSIRLVALALSATPPGELDVEVIRAKFDDYQRVWDVVGQRWLEYRRTDGSD